MNWHGFALGLAWACLVVFGVVGVIGLIASLDDETKPVAVIVSAVFIVWAMLAVAAVNGLS